MHASERSTDWSQVTTASSGGAVPTVAELWNYRDLMVLFMLRDIRTSYTQTLAGPAWLFLQPLLTSLVYVFVFSVVARIPIEGVPPFLYIFSGITVWLFFSECATSAARIFVTNAPLFSKVYFPRLCLPIASTATALVNFAFRLVPIALVYAYYAMEGAVGANPAWLAMLPMVVFGVGALGLSIGLLTASIGTRYRDALLVLTPLLQFAMFMTPVVYQITFVPERFRVVLELNPMVHFIDAIRVGMLGSGGVSGFMLTVSFAVTAILLVLSIRAFINAERFVVDTI